MRFTLQNDGHDTIALSGEQGKMPGSFVSRTTFVSDVDIPAGVDAPFERDAVLKRAMRGRAWLAGGPKLDKAVGADWKAPPDLSQGKKK